MDEAFKRLSAIERHNMAYDSQQSDPRSGRSPGEGHGNPFQYSWLENPRNRGAWRVALGSVRVHRVAECHVTEAT